MVLFFIVASFIMLYWLWGKTSGGRKNELHKFK